jgi:carboxymethylenebutenolidase
MTEAGVAVDDFHKYAAGEGPAELTTLQEQAEREGVFGVPTFIVAGEPFWGNDRIDWIVKKLDAMGLRRTA